MPLAQAPFVARALACAVLEPAELLARVCALIPPPRFHMVRYHGVPSSHAKARAEVVLHAPELAPKQLSLFGSDATIVAPEPRRKPWAWLLRHVFTPRLRRSVDVRGLRSLGFAIDVTTRPRCGGVTRWLVAANTPDAIARPLADCRCHP